jgi:hypothetical protein
MLVDHFRIWSVPALTYVTLQNKLFVGTCVVYCKGESYARCVIKLCGIMFLGKLDCHSHRLGELKTTMSDDVPNMSWT